MATKVRRSTGVPSIYRDAVTYIRARADRLRVKGPEDKAKKKIDKWLVDNGQVDDEGNIFYIFPAPVADTDGKLYKGVHKRYTPGDPFFLTEEVRAYFQNTKHYDTVFPEVTTRPFNEEALYLLEQQGKLPKSTIRELLHDGEPKYSLWPIPYEGEVSDDD